MKNVTIKAYYCVKGRGIVNYRKLGRTDIDVSEIGLGTEYLNGQPRDTVVSVVHEAIDNGVNYFLRFQSLRLHTVSGLHETMPVWSKCCR